MEQEDTGKDEYVTKASVIDSDKGDEIREAIAEESKKEDEKAAEAFLQENTCKEDEKAVEALVEETKKKEEKVAEASVEEYNKEDEKAVEASVEASLEETNEAGKVIEPSAKASIETDSSEKIRPKGLMAKMKIVKTRLRRLVKGKTTKSTPAVQGGNRERNESVLQGGKDGNSIENKNDVEQNMMLETSEADDKVAEASAKENDVEIKKVTEVPLEPSKNGESSEKKPLKRLKAKAKIEKPRATQIVKTKITKRTLQIQENKMNKNNSMLEGNKEGGSTEKKSDTELNASEGGQRKGATDGFEKNKQNLSTPQKVGPTEDGKKFERRRGMRGLRKKKKKVRKEPAATEKEQQNQHDGSEKEQKNKEKQNGLKQKEMNEKNKKLGGLIFMCNAKTKPDCFRYRVMGVSESKKDLVMRIRPGLKLFLYDYDLKLLYGVYQASSLGGMKLDSKAFGGSFPAQVRFKVHTDCYPLPESEFRKALKENYNTKNKFKTELTLTQVAKLRKLFRPSAVHSTALPSRRHLTSAASDAPSERSDKDCYASSSRRIHSAYARERGQPLLSSHREEPRDLYLSEREYRAYGLKRGERSQHQVLPTSDSYQKDVGRDRLLRHPEVVPIADPYRRDLDRDRLLRDLDRDRFLRHSDVAYGRREPVQTDPLYLTETEYRMCDLSARREIPASVAQRPATTAAALETYVRDPYYSDSYGSSVAERYLPSARREDRLYPTYAANAPTAYYQTLDYQGANTELAPSSVTSRYLFARPAYSYQ